MKELEYRIFDRYMELNKYKYNKKMFLEDDMYFCKIFKAHQIQFRTICDKHNCTYAFHSLEDRKCAFENNIQKFKRSI